MTKTSKEIILRLLDYELENEYEYQITSTKDMTHLKELLKAKIEVLKISAKGIDKLINNEIIRDDFKKYNIDTI